MHIFIPHPRDDDETDEHYQQRIEYYDRIKDTVAKMYNKHVMFIPRNGDQYPLGTFTVAEDVKCRAEMKIRAQSPFIFGNEYREDCLKNYAYDALSQVCKELDRNNVIFTPLELPL